MHMEQQRQLMFRERQQKRAAAAAMANLSTAANPTAVSLQSSTPTSSRTDQSAAGTSTASTSVGSTAPQSSLTAHQQQTQQQDTKRQLSLSVGTCLLHKLLLSPCGQPVSNPNDSFHQVCVLSNACILLGARIRQRAQGIDVYQSFTSHLSAVKCSSNSRWMSRRIIPDYRELCSVCVSTHWLASLSQQREQMLAAHEMFRNANRVTRTEKALILGFMAGARGESQYRHAGVSLLLLIFPGFDNQI